jgi:hypothetical protein
MSTPGRTLAIFSPGMRSVSPAKKSKICAGAARFADRLRQRLALFARQQAPELVAPGDNLLGDAQEDVVPLLRRRPRPRGERRLRRRDRVACLRGVGLRVFADDVAVCRRVDVARDAVAPATHSPPM